MKKSFCILLMLILISCTCYSEENACSHSFLVYHPYANYCRMCEQEKEVSYYMCTYCDGDGKIRCKSCLGSGSRKCSWCEILDKKGCSFCNYTGKVSCAKYETCSNCSGKGHNSIENKSCETCFTTVLCKYCGKHNENAYFAENCPICSPDAYSDFQYNTIMRNSGSHWGECYRFTGTIMSVERETYWILPYSSGDISFGEHGGANTLYRLSVKQIDNEITRYYSVYYIQHESNARLLPGDNIIVYGTLSYENSHIMPTFFASFIQLN